MYDRQVSPRRPAFAAVARESATRYGPDDQPERWQPGDFLLTRGDSAAARLIRWGQRLRIHGNDRRYTYWNHAALVVGTDGELIEALGSGVVPSHASKYRPKDYTVVRITADAEDRKEAAAFASWVAANHARYGRTTIVSISLTLLTGAKFSFFIDGEFICSGLVARALERTGAIFNRDPAHITPADLAKYYQAGLPT